VAVVDREVIGESAREESSGGKERRRSRRFGCEGFAEGFAIESGAVFRGDIDSISQTGCYVKTRARLNLKKHTGVDLHFMLKNRKYRTLARVISVRPGKGVGLEFMFYDPEGGELLKNDLVSLVDESMAEPA
jgi:hypothetical protein